MIPARARHPQTRCNEAFDVAKDSPGIEQFNDFVTLNSTEEAPFGRPDFSESAGRRPHPYVKGLQHPRGWGRCFNVRRFAEYEHRKCVHCSRLAFNIPVRYWTEGGKR